MTNHAVEVMDWRQKRIGGFLAQDEMRVASVLSVALSRCIRLWEDDGWPPWPDAFQIG